MSTFEYLECLKLIRQIITENMELDYPARQGTQPITITSQDGVVTIRCGDHTTTATTAKDIFKILAVYEPSSDEDEQALGVYRDLNHIL